MADYIDRQATLSALDDFAKSLRGSGTGWNGNDISEYGVYNEELDDWYVPTGWWENREFNTDDVYNNPIDCKVTHWMPLPDAPEAEE